MDLQGGKGSEQLSEIASHNQAACSDTNDNPNSEDFANLLINQGNVLTEANNVTVQQGVFEEEYSDESVDSDDLEEPAAWAMLSTLLRLAHRGEKFKQKMDALDQLYYCIYYAVVNEDGCRSQDLYLARPPSLSGKSNETNVLLGGIVPYPQFLEWSTKAGLMRTLFLDNLHLPSYVERVEKILRVFLVTSKFTQEDFELIWNVESDVHDTIQKHIYEMISRVASSFNEDILILLSERIAERWNTVKSYRDRKNLFDLMHKICYDELKDSFYAASKPRVHSSVRTVLERVDKLIPVTVDNIWLTKLLRLHVGLLERIGELYKNSDDLVEYMEKCYYKAKEDLTEPKSIGEKFLSFRHLSSLMAQKGTGAIIYNIMRQRNDTTTTIRALLKIGKQLDPQLLISEEYLFGIFSVLEFCQIREMDLFQFSSETESIVENVVSVLLGIVNEDNESDLRKETPSEVVLRLLLEIFRKLICKIPTSTSTQLVTGPNGIVDAFLNKYLFPASKAFRDSKNNLDIMDKLSASGSTQLQRSSTTSGIAFSQQQSSEDSLRVASIPKSATMNDLPLRQREITFTHDILMLIVSSIIDLSWSSLFIFKYIAARVQDLFSSGGSLPTDIEWDFEPRHIVYRTTSFVGLKNAGTTCYMNAIFQQMFWMLPMRRAILDLDLSKAPDQDNEEDLIDLGNARQLSYSCQIIQQLKHMFISLQDPQLPFYNTRPFLDIFRTVNGTLVNTRVQEDANEFWIRLATTIDAAFTECGEPKIVNEVLGGITVSQMIGKECGHLFEKEDEFEQVTIEILSHQTLADCLEQFVDGERLENDNAYFCATCNKKIAAVKREYFKKLPHILVFQLKRFGFDWERMAGVKSNEYFEFPMEIDMYPYTADGIKERELQQESMTPRAAPLRSTNRSSTMYRLKGVVVHTGDTEGGHYYSFIRLNDDKGIERWYKFDDIDICEHAIGAEQWFGGEEDVSNEMFRSSSKKIKRKFNAYLLLYERVGDELLVASEKGLVKAEDPLSSSNEEQREKLEMKVKELHNLHLQAQYSDIYFYFMTLWSESLTERVHHHYSSTDREMTPTMAEYLITAVDVFSNFLFSSGLHSHRAFACRHLMEGSFLKRWKHTMLIFMDIDASRYWFTANVLLHRKIIQLYLLESPVYDVRVLMMELINAVLLEFEDVSFEQLLRIGQPRHEIIHADFFQPGETVSEVFVRILMTFPHNAGELLLKNPAEFFLTLFRYCSSPYRRELLIRNDVLLKFLIMCLDDVHTPELLKAQRHLLNVVGYLLRSLMVFNSLRTSVSYTDNPYRMKDQIEGIQMPKKVANLFATVDQMKKVISLMIEECVRNNSEMTMAYETMAFLSYENMLICKRLMQVFDFERMVSRDLLENYMRCFFSFILINDSFSNDRVRIGLIGEPAGFKGFIPILYDIVENHYGRSYIMLKRLISFLGANAALMQIVEEDPITYAFLEDIILWFDSKISKIPWTYEATSNDLTPSSRGRIARTSSAVSLLIESEIIKEVLDKNRTSKDSRTLTEDELYSRTGGGQDDDPMLPESSKYTTLTDERKWDTCSLLEEEQMRQIGTFAGGVDDRRRFTSPEPDGMVMREIHNPIGRPSSPVLLRRCVGQENVSLSPIYDDNLDQNLDLYSDLNMDEGDSLPRPDRIDSDDNLIQPFSDDEDLEEPLEPEMNDPSDDEDKCYLENSDFR